MIQEKLRKIITACTVAATALIVFLLGVLIYQWVTIAVLNNRIEESDKEIAYWTEQNKNAENDLDYYESDYYLFFEAWERYGIEGK